MKVEPKDTYYLKACYEKDTNEVIKCQIPGGYMYLRDAVDMANSLRAAGYWVGVRNQKGEIPEDCPRLADVLDLERNFRNSPVRT